MSSLLSTLLSRLTVTMVFNLQIGQVGHRLDANFTLHRVVLNALDGTSGFLFLPLIKFKDLI